MTETTPAPDAGRDATLDLLVPAPSPTRRAGAALLGATLVALVAVGGLTWPRVGASAWGFTRTLETDRVAVGGTELRLSGLGLPVTLRAVEAPPGWRVRSAGVVDPSPSEGVDVVDTAGMTGLPARVRDGSRVVVEWELDCDTAVALLLDPATRPSILATEGPADDDGAVPVRAGDQAAHLDLRVPGGPALTEPAGGARPPVVVRTPTFDVAAACGLSPAAEAGLRTSLGR